MNDIKWAWVLFVAASLAVLIRLAVWLLPSPVVQHARQIDKAIESEPIRPGEPPPAAENTPPEEPPWPEEPEEPLDWAPREPVVWRPPSAEPLPPEPEPPPEEFYFRRTRWGMTPEEVLEAEHGQLLRQRDNRLLYSTTTLDMPCLLTYSFVQDRLVRARLSFSDPSGTHIPPLSVAQAQQRFLYLRGQLRLRYGEPIEQSTHQPRDISHLMRSVQKQDELAAQYDREIAETENRLRRQRERLETRYERWPNKAELVARGLKIYERDLRDLRTWKQESIDLAARSRKSIQEQRAADAKTPLVSTMSARWPAARGLHDIELRLDFRYRDPLLDIRYGASTEMPGFPEFDEL